MRRLARCRVLEERGVEGGGAALEVVLRCLSSEGRDGFRPRVRLTWC